jgi:hypothetical protein
LLLVLLQGAIHSSPHMHLGSCLRKAFLPGGKQ